MEICKEMIKLRKGLDERKGGHIIDEQREADTD